MDIMCTSIRINYPEGVVLARTMDYEVPLDYNIVYFPKDYHYADDLMGNPLFNKYEMMGVSFQNKNPLKDGVNQQGLAGCTNLFITGKSFSKDLFSDKLNLSSMDYFNYALGNYTSVKELVDDLDRIHISSQDLTGNNVICPPFHFYFMDRFGDSVVIEPQGKTLIPMDNPYGVLTNSPSFKSHERRLQRFLKKKNLQPAKDLPGGYDPVSRFIKAYYLKEHHIPATNSDDAFEQAYSILEALKLPQGFLFNEKYQSHTYTRYICAYDPGQRKMTIRTHQNPMIYSIDFHSLKNRSSRQSLFLPQKMMTTNL
ncbi:MAG: linear amide C-N hydrolase [Tissierellia bacterium]|nr:linear amide C-N hydrolase [Tissierellia bacterium]